MAFPNMSQVYFRRNSGTVQLLPSDSSNDDDDEPEVPAPDYESTNEFTDQKGRHDWQNQITKLAKNKLLRPGIRKKEYKSPKPEHFQRRQRSSVYKRENKRKPAKSKPYKFEVGTRERERKIMDKKGQKIEVQSSESDSSSQMMSSEDSDCNRNTFNESLPRLKRRGSKHEDKVSYKKKRPKTKNIHLSEKQDTSQNDTTEKKENWTLKQKADKGVVLQLTFDDLKALVQEQISSAIKTEMKSNQDLRLNEVVRSASPETLTTDTETCISGSSNNSTDALLKNIQSCNMRKKMPVRQNENISSNKINRELFRKTNQMKSLLNTSHNQRRQSIQFPIDRVERDFGSNSRNEYTIEHSRNTMLDIPDEDEEFESVTIRDGYATHQVRRGSNSHYHGVCGLNKKENCRPTVSTCSCSIRNQEPLHSVPSISQSLCSHSCGTTGHHQTTPRIEHHVPSINQPVNNLGYNSLDQRPLNVNQMQPSSVLVPNTMSTMNYTGPSNLTQNLIPALNQYPSTMTENPIQNVNQMSEANTRSFGFSSFFNPIRETKTTQNDSNDHGIGALVKAIASQLHPKIADSNKKEEDAGKNASTDTTAKDDSTKNGVKPANTTTPTAPIVTAVKTKKEKVGCIKPLLIIANILMAFTGVGMLTLGMMIMSNPDVKFYTDVARKTQDDKSFKYMNYGLCFVGIMTIFIWICGCCGVIKVQTCLLKLFIAFVSISLFLQLCLFGVLFAIKGQSISIPILSAIANDIGDNLFKHMKYAVTELYVDGSLVKRAWDILQIETSCCGVESPEDYKYSAWKNASYKPKTKIPDACCVLKEKNYTQPEPTNRVLCQAMTPGFWHDLGCFEVIKTWYNECSVTMLGVLGPLIIFEVLCLVFGARFFLRIKQIKKSAKAKVKV